MTTIFNNLRTINGVLSTDKTVMQNINTLCTAAGAWMTFDVNTGKWAVIINDPSFSSVVKSFTDSNIIGGINVSGTGLSQMYNKVTLEFPHKDLRDEKDYVDLLIPDADRYTRELDNTLNMQIDCINDPIQALRIATIELKQSRLDKIIEFRTDFTAIGLKAGDVIQVTASPYGYTNKQFRIIKMIEEDAVSGPLTLSITALEYDSTIYDTTDLVREERVKYTQIMPKQANDVVKLQDQYAGIGNLLGGLAGPLGASAIIALLNKLIGAPNLADALTNNGATIGGNETAYASAAGPLTPGTDLVTDTPPGGVTAAQMGPYSKGTYAKVNETSFTCTKTGNYKIEFDFGFSDSRIRTDPTFSSGQSIFNTFKNILVSIKSGGYYSGSLGSSSTYLRTTADLIIASAGFVSVASATDNVGDQYSEVSGATLVNLRAGTTYFVNTFVCMKGNANSEYYKTVEVRFMQATA
jgi:hypothetical protein